MCRLVNDQPFTRRLVDLSLAELTSLGHVVMVSDQIGYFDFVVVKNSPEQAWWRLVLQPFLESMANTACQ